MISILVRASAETLERVAEQARGRACEITVRGKLGRLHTAVLTCTATQAWQIYSAAGVQRLREERIRCIDHAEAVALWLPGAES